MKDFKSSGFLKKIKIILNEIFSESDNHNEDAKKELSQLISRLNI